MPESAEAGLQCGPAGPHHLGASYNLCVPIGRHHVAPVGSERCGLSAVETDAEAFLDSPYSVVCELPVRVGPQGVRPSWPAEGESTRSAEDGRPTGTLDALQLSKASNLCVQGCPCDATTA